MNWSGTGHGRWSGCRGERGRLREFDYGLCNQVVRANADVPLWVESSFAGTSTVWKAAGSNTFMNMPCKLPVALLHSVIVNGILFDK